jgi:hypothetical protein
MDPTFRFFLHSCLHPLRCYIFSFIALEMYNNIGLSSVRGSGTSGYVQKNLAAVPKHRQNMSWEASLEREEKTAQRKPVQYVADREILDHERKKKIEIAVLEWAEATGILDSEYVAYIAPFQHVHHYFLLPL